MKYDANNTGRSPAEQRILAISEMEKAAADERQRYIGELEFCLGSDLTALIKIYKGDRKPVRDLVDEIIDTALPF